MRKYLFPVYFFVVIWMLLSPSIKAQISFLKTYGDSLSDEGVGILQTTDSGYAVAAYKVDYIADKSSPTPTYRKQGNIMLMKTDKFGDSLWTKTYGFDYVSAPGQILQTEDGGFIISGYLYQTPAPLNLLIRTDSKGDTLWTRTYGHVLSRGWNNLLQTKDGNYVLAGIFDSTYYDYYPTIIKIDKDGTKKWVKRYLKQNIGAGSGITETDDNGFMLALEGSAVLKADSLGNFISYKYLLPRDTTMNDGGSEFDLITRTQDGGYYLIGTRTVKFKYGGGDLEYHLTVIKTNSEGDTLWTKKLGKMENTDWGYGTLYPHAYYNMPDGGLIISGRGTPHDFLLRMDSEGNEAWMKYNIVQASNDYISVWNSVKRTSDGGFIATGYKWLYLTSEEKPDVILLKTDGNGNTTGINDAEVKNNLVNSFKLNQNYPNPFNPSTRITYNLDKESNVDLSIYNMLGEKITTLVSKNQSAGNHSFDLNISSSGLNLQSGIYIYVLKTDNSYAARKMALIK